MEVYPPEDPAPGEVVGGPSVSQLEQMRAWDASLTQLEKVIQEACETEVHPNVNNWSKELTITPVTTSGSSSIKHDVKRKFEEHETDGTENLRLKNVRTNEMLPSFTQGSGISADSISSSCDTLNSDFNTLATIVPLKDISKDQMTHSESKAEKEIDNKNEITNVKEPVTTFDVLETKVFPNSPEKHETKGLLVEDSKKDLKDLNITDSKENIDFADCKKDNVIDDKDSFNLNDCKNVNIKCEINEVKDVGIPLDSEEHDDLSTNIKNQESCLLHNSEDPINREVASGITESSCNDSTENLENLAVEKKLKDKKKKKDDESSESSKNSKKEDKQGKKKKFERCNIRDIKLEDDLDEVTLAAQKEEQERIRRIQEAHMRALQERLQQIEDEKEVLTQLFSQPPAEASHLFDSNSEGNAEASDDSVTKPDVPLIRNENDVILLDNSENNKKTDLQELIVPPSSENVIDISSSSSDSDSEGEEEDDDELGKKDDDIMVLSDEGDAEPEETSDPNNSGAHTNDCFNLVDMEGRVLVNVGHPPEDPDIFLAPQIAKVIKPHQIGGIRFLYDNVVENLERYKSSSGFGCILAHSMGLGKTVQVVSFVDVFLRHTPATLVLCIVPINTIQNWKAEFDMWVPSSNNVDEALVESGEIRPRDYNVYTLNENFKSMAGRSTLIAEWRKQGGVLLMGYEMYRMLALRKMPKIPVKKSKRQKKLEANVEPETNEQIKKFMDQMYEHIVIPGPDLVICDEGHRIKNSLASTSMALKSIKTRRRVVLTGYPLQNNLLEYWCMVDFVRPNYLGSRAEFCNMFERPISNGQCTDSTPRDRQLMRFRSHVLHSLLVGFVQRRGHSVLRAVLPKKEEHVLLIRMTPIQRKLYKCFVKDLLYVQQATNPLKLFAVCCKIWNHPDILYKLLQEKKAHEDIDLDIDLSTLAPGSALPGSNSVLKRKGVAIPKDQKSKGIQRPIRATPQPAKIQPKNVKQLALLPPPSPQSQGQQLLPVKIEPQQLCSDQLSPDGQNCKHMPDQIQYPQQHSNQVSMQDYSSTMHSQSKSPHSSQQQNQYHQPQHLDYSHSMQHEFPTQQSVQTSFQQSQFASPSASQQFCQPKYSQQQYQQQSQKCQSHYHQQQFTSQPNTQPSPPSQYSQQPLLQQQFPSQSQNLGSQQQFSTSPSISQQSYMQQPSQSQQQYSPSSTTPQQSSVQTQQQFSQQRFSPQSVTPSPQQFSQKPSGQSPQQFPQSPSAPQHQSTPQSQQSYPHSASQSFSVQSSAQQEPQFHPQSPTQHQHFSQQTVSQQFTQSSTSQQQYQSTSNSQQFTQQHAAQQQFSHSTPSQQSFVPPSSTQQQSYSQQQQPQAQQPPSQQQSYSKQSQPPPGQQQQQFLSQTQQFPPQPNSQPQFQQASQQQQYCQQSNNVQPFSQQSTKLKEQTQYCQQSSQPQYSQPNTQQQYSQQQYSQQNTQQQQYSQQSNVQQKQQYAQQGNAQQQFSCQSPPQSQFNQQSHVTPQNFPQVSPQQQFSQPSPPLPSQQFSQPSPQSQFSQQSPPQKYPRQSPPQQMFPQASPPVQQFSQPSPSQQFPHQSSPQQLPSPQQYSQSSPTQVYSQQFSQHSPSPYTQPSPPHQKYSQLQHQYSQEPSTQQPYQSSQISQYPQQPSPHQPYSQLPQQSSSQQQYSQQSQQYIHTGQQYPRQDSPQQNFSQQSLQKQYSQANQQQYSHQSIQQQAQYSQQPPAQNPFSQQQQQQSNSHSQFSQPSSQASQQQFPLPPSQVQQYGTSQTQSTAQQQFNRQSPISSSPPQFTQQQPSQQQFVQQQQTSSQPQFTQQTQTSSQHQFNQQSTSSQQQQFNQKQATQSQQQYSQQISQTSISQKYNQQNIKSPSSQSYTQPSQSGSAQYQQPYSQQPPQSSPSPQYSQHNQGGQTQQYQHSFNQQTNQQQVNQSFQQQFTQNQTSTPSSLQPIAQVPPTKQGKSVGRGKQARGKQVCQVPPPPYTQQAAEKPFSPQNYQQHSPLQAVVQRQNLQQTAKQPQKRINQHHFQPIIKQEGITLLPVKQEPNTVPAKCQKAILQSMKQPCQALVHSRQQMQPSLIKKQQPDCAPVENEQENGGTVQEVGMLPPYRDRIDSSISYEWAIPLMKDYVLGVLENSHKMMVLFEIIEETLHVGDKLLVFSQSLSTLDLLEHFLNKEKIPKCSDSSEDLPSEHWCRNKNYFRLDGSTSAQEREKLINEFNNNDKISLFLLSTRAGCLGINLVGANRIVVMDASWNPCHDAQAVCRIYRYGQKKPCHIYRLVTDNSLEKRIYDRQVNKQGMSDRVVDELNPESNFTWKDVTTLIQDDEDDGPAQDLTNFASSYTDEVLKYLVTKMSASLSKEPFEHESLLLDRKDLKLTKQEKRMAKQSYEMAKRANMINIRTTYTYLPAGSTGTGGQFIINNKQCQWVGGTTIRVLPTQSTSVSVQSGTGATLRSGTTATPITASPALMSNLFKQGVMVQKLTMPSNISIPVLTPGAPPVVIPAGQDVLVLRTPKGVYLRLPDGRIIAVQLPPSLLAKTQFRPNVVTHFRPAQKGNNQTAVVNSGRGQSIGIIKQTLQCGGTVRFIGPRNSAGGSSQNTARQSAPEVIDLSDDDEPSAKKCSASSSSSTNSIDNESGTAEQQQQEPSQDPQAKPSPVPIQQKQITIRRISPASQPNTIQLPSVQGKCELPMALQQSQQITIMPINPSAQQQSCSKSVPTVSQSVSVKPMVLPNPTEKRKVTAKNATKIQLPMPLLSAKHLQQNQVTISPAPQFQPQLQQSKLRQAIPSQLTIKPQESLPVAITPVSQQLHADLKTATQPVQSSVQTDSGQSHPSPQPQLLQSLPISQSQQNTQPAQLTQVQHMPRPALKQSQSQLETTQPQSHSSPVLSQHNNQGQLQQVSQSASSPQTLLQPASLTSQTQASNIPLHQPHIPPQQNPLVKPLKMQQHPNSSEPQHSHLTHSYVQQKQTSLHPAQSSTVTSQPVHPNPSAIQPRKRKQPSNRQTSKKTSATQPNVQNNMRPAQPSEIAHQFPHAQLPDPHLPDNLFPPFSHLPSSDFQTFAAFSPHKPVPQIQHPQPLHPLQHNQEHSLPSHLQHMAHMYPLQHIPANQPSISDLQPQAPRAWPVPQPPVSSFHPFGQSSPYYNSGHSHESNQFSFQSSFTSSQPPTTSSITQSEQSNVSGIDQPPSICSSEL